LLGARLDIHLGFTPLVGTSFMIVDNTGPAPVLDGVVLLDPQGNPLNRDGASFVVGGNQTFVINYHGGDGNDVVITRDTPPAFQNRSVTSPVREGKRVTLTGKITEPDPNDTFFLDVNWGDGSPVQTYTFAPGSSRDVSVTHRYRLDSNGCHKASNAKVFTIHLIWRDNHGGSNSVDLQVSVTDAPWRRRHHPHGLIIEEKD
jgi:hypothetical protein